MKEIGNTDQIEVIVDIPAEGGSITLYGRKDSKGEWIYSRGVNDQTPTLLNDDDGGGSAIAHSSAWVKSWPEALALLDRYPWAMLGGAAVHPEFCEHVWAEVTKRLQRQSGRRVQRAKERWSRACGIAGSSV
jgi:hypothetical protein